MGNVQWVTKKSGGTGDAGRLPGTGLPPWIPSLPSRSARGSPRQRRRPPSRRERERKRQGRSCAAGRSPVPRGPLHDGHAKREVRPFEDVDHDKDWVVATITPRQLIGWFIGRCRSHRPSRKHGTARSAPSAKATTPKAPKAKVAAAPPKARHALPGDRPRHHLSSSQLRAGRAVAVTTIFVALGCSRDPDKQAVPQPEWTPDPILDGQNGRVESLTGTSSRDVWLIASVGKQESRVVVHFVGSRRRRGLW